MFFNNFFLSNDGWTETHYGNEQTLTINKGNDDSKNEDFCLFHIFN